MRQSIRYAKERAGKETMPAVLAEWLPQRFLPLLSLVSGHWDELHLRVGRACSVTVGGENRSLDAAMTSEEMEALLMRLCEGSLYAHRESLLEGYIALKGGIRVGVCGQAMLADGGERLLGVRAVDTLCIRFPHPLRGLGEGIEAEIRRCFPLGTLIFAPPGEGKTSLLRSLAARFSSGEAPLRVAVVDTRRELDDGGFDDTLCLSVLSGYPKGLGIEIAARTMNAQLIVCDEIGADEAGAIVQVANCGVPVIASAHAATVDGLLHRPSMRALHEAAVFGQYVCIHRRGETRDFGYDVTRWEEVDDTRCS